jgi:hypothetical protein
MAIGVMEQKSTSAEASYAPSLGQGVTTTSNWQNMVAEFKDTFLTRDGWIGDYVCSHTLGSNPGYLLTSTRTTCIS